MRVSKITLYILARNVPLSENGHSCMTAMKITLTKRRQYGGSDEMPCRSLSAI